MTEKIRVFVGGLTPTGRAKWTAALVMVLATIVQPVAVFAYDAAVYWAGSLALVNGTNFGHSGHLGLRGIMTPLMYSPVAFMSLADPSAASYLVLLENAVLLAVLGAILVPSLVELWRPLEPRIVFLCALLSWLLLARFAPYPLMDLWACVLAMGAVVLLGSPRLISLGGAGLCAGVAVNIRPAYSLTAALILLVVGVGRRWRVLWMLAGFSVPIALQMIKNHSAGWLPVPVDEAYLAKGQLASAAYLVRYDTVLGRDAPVSYWCDPPMARIVADGSPITSYVDLAKLFVKHPVQSVPFLFEKIAGSVHWPVSVPYLTDSRLSNGFFALLVTTVTTVGSLYLAWRLRPISIQKGALLCVWLGAVATLVVSGPETRFALPLVVVGIVGLGAAAWTPSGPRIRRFVAVSVAVVAAVFAAGVFGLAHEMVAPVPSPRTPDVVTCFVCRQGVVRVV